MEEKKDWLKQPLHLVHQARLEKKVSTKQIVEQAFEKIRRWDKEVGAFLSLANAEQMLVAAEKADAKLQKGNPVDLVEAMPLAIKDIFNVLGEKTTCGSKMLENYIAPYEATTTQKLKDLGYGYLGKTNMDEFAMGSSTERSAFHPTKNPWNKDFVPGGSSGGSAAAVAAGFCLGSLGTDTGGSIRQPAGFCGVVGLKPTYGRVSRYGMVAFASSLDQGGPITHDVEDAALLFERISGYDPKDPTSLNLPAFAYDRKEAQQGAAKLKLGVIEDLDLKFCSEEVRANFALVLENFQKSGGLIEKVSIPHIQQSIATYYIVATAEASSNLGRYDGVRYGFRKTQDSLSDLYSLSREYGFGEEVKLRILLGTFVLSAGYYDAYYGKAKKVQALLRKEFQQAFEKVDLLALPVAPTTAFPLAKMVADPMEMYLQDIFTLPANLTGIPGISVPSGLGKNNLPIGTQFLAAPCAENRLIQIGHWLEKTMPQPAAKLFFES